MSDEDRVTIFSEYPTCIDVQDDLERPNHANWVIPQGTKVLVDYDSPMREKVLRLLYKLRSDIDSSVFVKTPEAILNQQIERIEAGDDV